MPAFTPWYKPPVSNGAGKCTDAQLTEMAKVCFAANSTAQTCDAFLGAAANQACAGCLVLPDGALQFGPLVPNFGVNFYGCVALVENDLTATSCAAKVALSDECTARACTTCTDSKAFGQCQEGAAAAACKPYVDAGRACSASLPQAASQCVLGQNEAQDVWAKRVAARFCGPRS